MNKPLPHLTSKRRLDSLPQWSNICWSMSADALLSDLHIHALYRRNWSHVEVEKLSQEDWDFIRGLGTKYGECGEFSPLKHWADMTIQERQEEVRKREKEQELIDLVKIWVGTSPPEGFDPEDFIGQWVHQKNPRLANDRPSDLFFSQDGMAKVEALLQEAIRSMLSNTH